MIFHVDALTGEDVLGDSPAGQILQGLDAVSGEAIDGFMLRTDDKIVVLIDKYLQVRSSPVSFLANLADDAFPQCHLYPGTDQSDAAFLRVADKVYFPLGASDRILGHKVTPLPELSGKHVAYPIWTTLLPPGEVLFSRFVRPADEPVASFGKVLGDRRTLYKYLPPGLFGLITGSPVRHDCSVYVIDGVKGSIVYHAVLPSANGQCNVKAVLTENWLLYTFYDEEIASQVQAKGQHVVSVEFYEGSQIDDKTKRYVKPMYREC